MGTIIHDIVAVVVYYRNDDMRDAVSKFRDTLPPEFQQLVVGPIPTAINQMENYLFLPDGSKEGWECSEQGDGYREQFIALFDEYAEGVAVRFGHDQFLGPTAVHINEEEPS